MQTCERLALALHSVHSIISIQTHMSKCMFEDDKDNNLMRLTISITLDVSCISTKRFCKFTLVYNIRAHKEKHANLKSASGIHSALNMSG